MTIFNNLPPILDAASGGYPTLIYKRATYLSTLVYKKPRALTILRRPKSKRPFV